MCTRTDHDGACEDCARTDEWVDLTATQEPQTTTMPQAWTPPRHLARDPGDDPKETR